MASSTKKIESYINASKNKTQLELANEEILKIFGDETTYNRFVLINLNKKITDCFAITRGDGLYMSCEMALRGFDGGYKEFAKFHNASRFDYPVIKTARDQLFNLELGVFCCGAVRSDTYIKKYGYYDMFNNNDSCLVHTPSIISYDMKHPNYQFIKQNLEFNREKGSPINQMDEQTLCAFTQFRIMVYTKAKEYMDYGISDKLAEMGISRIYRFNDNPYAAYALALLETSQFFKTFYSPDMVKFTNSTLPYKGLGVMEQKVANIRTKYNLETIGTIRHFNSALNLPMLRQDLYAITNLLVKYSEFKGQYVADKEQYKQAFSKVQNVMLPPSLMEFDGKGRSKFTSVSTTIDIKEAQKEAATTLEIDKALTECSNALAVNKNKQYTVDDTVGTMVEKTKNRAQALYNYQSRFARHYVVMSKFRSEIENLRTSKNPQLPMFLEVDVYGKQYMMTDLYPKLSHHYYDTVVEMFKVVGDTLSAVISLNNSVCSVGQALTKSEQYVTQKEEELETAENDKNVDPKQEHELYSFVDAETKEQRVGSYEMYELNQAKMQFNLYEQRYQEQVKMLADKESELKLCMDEAKEFALGLVKEGAITVDDLYGIDKLLDVDVVDMVDCPLND